MTTSRRIATFTFALAMLSVVKTVVATTGPTPTVTATPGCGLAPEVGCRAPVVPGKASIALTDNADDTKDKLAWSWVKAAATAKVEFGDPTTTTAYDLCIYDATPTLVLTASIPPDGVCGLKPCWKEGRHGFSYANKLLTPDGVQQLALTEGLDGKAKITAKGKGVNLDMPPLPLTPPVRVQLKSTAGACWEAVYSVPSKNDPMQFKAKDRIAPSPSVSPTSTPTLSASAPPGTPTPTPVETPVPTLTTTPTLTATATPTAAPILTATPTPTVTATPAEHYVDNGDGTVTDNDTGLQWEKKDNVCPGIHCVDDPYDATGFFPTLNAGSGFAGHTDWRLPTFDELQAILLAPYPCGTSPCIDPIFGPTIASLYVAAPPTDISPLKFVGLVNFSNGYAAIGPASESIGAGNSEYVRGVRSLP